MMCWAVARAVSGRNSTCVAPVIFACGFVVITWVWNREATFCTFGMMHWTSTTMTSTAPVAMASSCCTMAPARLTPRRMRTSLPVQHIPTTLIGIEGNRPLYAFAVDPHRRAVLGLADLGAGAGGQDAELGPCPLPLG